MEDCSPGIVEYHITKDGAKYVDEYRENRCHKVENEIYL